MRQVLIRFYVEIKLGDLQLNISKEIMVTDSSNISIYDTITNDVVDTSILQTPLLFPFMIQLKLI